MHSLETRPRAFSIFPKILLLLTAMDFPRKAMFRFFHVSVHAFLPSLRSLKSARPLCGTANSSQSTWERTKTARRSHRMILSQASMRLLPMPMCLSSTFLVPIRQAYGVYGTSTVILSLTSPRLQWSATTRLASAAIAQCSPGS
jgi:hypothetical protein